MCAFKENTPYINMTQRNAGNGMLKGAAFSDSHKFFYTTLWHILCVDFLYHTEAKNVT